MAATGFAVGSAVGGPLSGAWVAVYSGWSLGKESCPQDLTQWGWSWSVGMALGQRSTSGTTDGGPVTRCAHGCGSPSVLGGLLRGHWVGTWAGIIGPGLWLRKDRTKSQGCFKVQAGVCRSVSEGPEDCVSQRVPGEGRKFPAHSWEGLEPGYRAVSGSAVRP